MDHLPRREVKDPFAIAFDLRHGHAAQPGQLFHGDRSMVVATNMIVDDRQPLPRRVSGMRLLKIVRDPRHADHLAVNIAQRQLCVRHQPRSRPL